MAIDLSDTLVVGISATALFNLSEVDAVFREKFKEDKDTAIQEYRDICLNAKMTLVKVLLILKKYQSKELKLLLCLLEALKQGYRLSCENILSKITTSAERE